MSEAINETIKEVAVNHGVVLSKDDPILILQTMNERMLAQNRKAQQDMLAQFKEEMETISSQWKDDANKKAERVLNAALVSSKEAMINQTQASAKELMQSIQLIISDSIAKSQIFYKVSIRYSKFVLIATTTLLALSYLSRISLIGS